MLFSNGNDELRASLYKDTCKTIGITYLDLEEIINRIKN